MASFSNTSATNQTAFNAYSLLLFCGSITLDTFGRGIIVDGSIRLRGWARIGVLVSRLRTILDEALAQTLDNVNEPEESKDSAGQEKVHGAVDLVRRLVMYNGHDQ